MTQRDTFIQSYAALAEIWKKMILHELLELLSDYELRSEKKQKKSNCVRGCPCQGAVTLSDGSGTEKCCPFTVPVMPWCVSDLELNFHGQIIFSGLRRIVRACALYKVWIEMQVGFRNGYEMFACPVAKKKNFHHRVWWVHIQNELKFYMKHWEIEREREMDSL